MYVSNITTSERKKMVSRNFIYLEFTAACEVHIYATHQMEYKGNTAFRNLTLDEVNG
jgi:hypothetical protein